MGVLKLNCWVYYPPGPWGLKSIAVGVSVEILETHRDGTTSSIWAGLTNGEGNFSGTTVEWRRKVPGGHDLFDTLLLTCRLKDTSGGRSYDITIPFVWLSDFLPSPPIVLPWSPPLKSRGCVNGATFSSVPEVLNRAKTTIESGQSLTLDLFVYGGIGPSARQKMIDIVADASLFVQRAERAVPLAGSGGQRLQLAGAQSIASRVQSANTSTTLTSGFGLSTATRQTAAELLAGAVAAVLVVPVTIALAAVISLALPILVLASIAAAVVTIIQNLPQILQAVALIFSAAGLNGAASAMQGAANDIRQYMNDSGISEGLNAMLAVCAVGLAVIMAILNGLKQLDCQLITSVGAGIGTASDQLGLRVLISR